MIDIFFTIHDIQKASDAVNQKNRALLAVLKAEFRKEATTLEDEIRQLQQLVKHGGKKLSPEIEKERLERLAEAREAVEEFSKNSQSSENGFSPLRPIAKFKSKEFASGTRIDINGSGLASADSRAYMHTDQTKEFTREASLAKERQDIALENIERGLSTLKDLGGAMGEELQRHDGVIDEVGAKMEAVTTEIQNNNMKLKGIVTQVRSTRRFFIDIILICVLLAIGLYIFNMLD